MVRASPGSPSQWNATWSPCPASTCRSTQLTATLSLPPTNHFANGASHSRTVSHFWAQVSRSACSAQNPSRSVVGTRVPVLGGVGLRGELRARREVAALVRQVGKGGSRVGHGRCLVLLVQRATARRCAWGSTLVGRVARRTVSPGRGELTLRMAPCLPCARPACPIRWPRCGPARGRRGRGKARDAVVTLHHHPVNRTGWTASAAEAALRAARASAALDGARLVIDRRAGAGRRRVPRRRCQVVADPVLAGAVRAAEATGRLLGVWRTAPLQALARLHVLAAADLGGGEPGRPVRGSARLALLADLVTGGDDRARARARGRRPRRTAGGGALPVGERRGGAGGGTARSDRVGAGPAGARGAGGRAPSCGGGVPTSGARASRPVRPRASAAWIRHCCDQWVAGAREGRSIAEARAK